MDYDQDEEVFDPIRKITHFMNEQDMKVIENEARIMYTKSEIDKLRAETQKLNIDRKKLEAQIDTDKKEIQELNDCITINRKSLELQSEVLVSIKNDQMSTLQTKSNELIKQHDTIYNEHLEKYKTIKSIYEIHHPCYKQLKQLKTEKLKKEVEYKILDQKINEIKKINKHRCEVRRKIFHSAVTEFIGVVQTNSRAVDFALKIKTAEKERDRLVPILRQLEINAITAQRAAHSYTASKNSYVSVQLPTMDFTSSLQSSSDSVPYSQLPYTNIQQDMLQQVKKRCDLRQQAWRQRSTFTLKRPLSINDTFAAEQKRLSRETNLQSSFDRNCNRINIISVQTVADANKPHFKQPENINTRQNAPTQSMSILTQYKPVHSPIFTDVKTSSMHQEMLRENNAKRSAEQNIVSQSVLKQCAPEQSGMFKENVKSRTAECQGMSQENSNAEPPSSFKQWLPLQQEIHKGNVTDSSVRTLSMNSSMQPPSIFKPNETVKSVNTPIMLQQNFLSHTQGIRSVPAYHSQQTLLSQSQQISSQTQSSFINTPGTTGQSQVGLSQNLNQMNLMGSQLEQNKIQSNTDVDTSGTSQSSTFSQKCQQLNQILAKNKPEANVDITSTVEIQSSQATADVVTSPFFNPSKAQAVHKMNNRGTSQLPSALQDTVMNYSNQEDIDALLDNSDLYGDNEPTHNASCADATHLDQFLLSPSYDVEQENINPNLQFNEAHSPASPFTFNFQQPQSQSNGTKPFFTGSSNIFNMF